MRQAVLIMSTIKAIRISDEDNQVTADRIRAHPSATLLGVPLATLQFVHTIHFLMNFRPASIDCRVIRVSIKFPPFGEVPSGSVRQLAF